MNNGVPVRRYTVWAMGLSLGTRSATNLEKPLVSSKTKKHQIYLYKWFLGLNLVLTPKPLRAKTTPCHPCAVHTSGRAPLLLRLYLYAVCICIHTYVYNRCKRYSSQGWLVTSEVEKRSYCNIYENIFT